METVTQIPERRYTIDEIQKYLERCMLMRGDGVTGGKLEENSALRIALMLLKDEEDGIEAICDRSKR